MSEFIEQCEPDSSTMDFPVCSSVLSDTNNETREDMNVVISKAKDNLTNCLKEYKEKAHKHNKILEQLGCSASDIPKSTRKRVINAFRENDAFKYNGVGSKELVMINPEYVMSSLQDNKKTADILLLNKQAEVAITMIENLDDCMNRALKEDYEPANQDLVCYKRALMVKYSTELDKYTQESQLLQQLPLVMLKQKYTLEKLKDLEHDQNELKAKKALVSSKLEKYFNLSLSQSKAARSLAQLKQELKDVDNKIKMKVQT